MEAKIQEEEALVRVYEAELGILKRKGLPSLSPTGQFDHNGEDDDDDDDILEELFLHPIPAMEIAPRDSEKTECLELTQSIQDFVFTSVEDKSTQSSEASALPSPQVQYILKGHFVSRSNITAIITMNTERKHMMGNPQRKRKRDMSSRVVDLTYQLETTANEDLRKVETLASRYAHKNSFSDWIQRVSAYLKFDKLQQDALDDLKKSFPDFEWSKDEESLNILVFPGGKEKQNSMPVFDWGWSWKDEKDILAMRGETNFELTPKGLQDLVSVAGGCREATEMIMKALRIS